VWYCKWAPNGKLLATGSKDCTVILWNFDPNTLKLSQYKV
jgi:WD40 repeat protein